MRTGTKPGFTLIEISIVLIIIGLITGSILVSKELIRQAYLRKVMTQLEQYKTAVHTFKSKYGCLPGDCEYATDFWTQRATSCTPAVGIMYVQSAGQDTCDGDGDSIIDNTLTPEPGCFWQHLSNAGLITSGKYDCSINTLPSLADANNAQVTGVPKLMVFTNVPQQTGSSTFWFLSGNTLRVLGISGSPGSYNLQNPGISPQDAFFLDGKVDDGKPFAGKMQQGSTTQHPVLATRFNGCIVSNMYDDPDALYNMQNNAVKCLLGLEMGF